MKPKKIETTEGDLRKTDWIEKFPNQYVHHSKVVYPHANVLSMKKAWKEKGGALAAWLEGFSQIREAAIDSGLKELEAERVKIVDEIAKYGEQNEKEIFEEFMKVREKKIQEKKDFLENIEKKKEELVQAVDEQLEPMRQKNMTDLKNLQQALKLWSQYD